MQTGISNDVHDCVERYCQICAGTPAKSSKSGWIRHEPRWKRGHWGNEKNVFKETRTQQTYLKVTIFSDY